MPDNSIIKKDARKKIEKLTDRFSRNADVYRNAHYNETQVRREFIDPFFEALGWDVTNKSGYAEQYKDVVHEDSVKIGISLKSPDYSFRIGGQRKFFLEAKKPFVNIKNDINPAYQVRRYSWSAKLPLSIVTNFEEFAVYDCRIKPFPDDKAVTGRIAYYTFEQYLQKFDDIYNIFSKEAVLMGSFDRYTISSKGKRGTAEVDKEFLIEIEKWRESLARNIALRNPYLDIYELNFSVQHTIDRIIFLRICEDRGIENYSSLGILLNGTNIYNRLLQLFDLADQKYNSGLFDFNADKLSHTLIIDDKALKEIIENLYYPKSPYEFSVIGADILGNVYEQFLGKVIRLTAGHQAKVEEKPEVKKAGGVYYTPQYIVEYIVRNTVGRLIEGKTPSQVDKIKILDPACGSGSFLIGVYRYLLDWYLNWYTSNNPQKHSKGKYPLIYSGAGGVWRLTTSEKKRILLNNIFGVDVDRQAVEVTKLSLLLKLLEDENQETINKTLALFRERVLPNLEANIKCGNSLIGPDFYDQLSLILAYENVDDHSGLIPPQDYDIRKINAFDWYDDEKGFGKILKEGGFDVVIGNPPYGAEFTENTLNYLKNKFTTHVWRGESYLLFIEQGINLLKSGGLFGFITPDTYLNLGFTQPMRAFLLRNSRLYEIVQLPSKVFSGATVDTTLLFTEKVPTAKTFNEVDVRIRSFNKKAVITAITQAEREFMISTNSWYKQNTFNISSNENEHLLISHIDNQRKQLSSYADIFYGIKAYQVGKGNPSQSKTIRDTKPFTSNVKKNENFQPFFDGKHIGRYSLLWQEDNWLKYGQWLAEPRNPEKFEGEKILIRKIIGQTLIATYIAETSYCNTLLYVLTLNQKIHIRYLYLLGILNSHFIGWYFRKKFQISPDDTFPQIMIRDILQLPIPETNKTLHDKMVSLVEQMLDLNKKLQHVKIAHDRDLIERQLKITDNYIDRLVYELYGLTEEEIAVITGPSLSQRSPTG